MSLVCTSKSTPNVRFIARGSYGTIYLINNVVIKVANDAKEERKKHIMLWKALSPECKKYFVKPLKIPTNCRAQKGYSSHAMEYVTGVNMHEFVKYALKTGNKDAVAIVMNKLKKAIMCLWKSGFIHNDLHMRNVLVTDTGIKIIDFGLSEKVTPLKTPFTNKQITNWFTNKYTKSLNKLGFNVMNPNLYAYGIEKHNMFSKLNQKLYNKCKKCTSTSIKVT